MRLLQLIFPLLSVFVLAGCLSNIPSATIPDPATALTPVLQQEDNESTAVISSGNEGKSVETGDSQPLELETLADNQLLQGYDQFPPDEADEVLAPAEPIYDFPVVENDKVRYFIDYFTGRANKTFKIWLERSGRYLPMMREIFAEAGLPQDLAYLAMIESGFNTKAYSWAHAVGPWQFTSLQ